jgi:threonine dehydratase
MQSEKLAQTYRPSLQSIEAAADKLKAVVLHTPLMQSLTFSEKFEANIVFKREDLQIVRSYKIRGAFHKISGLSAVDQSRGVVCASAGNHAQGVAYSCQKLRVKATIFMPSPTPKQKVEQVAFFGKEFVTIILNGDTFDDAQEIAKQYCVANNSVFIPPFDDEKVIEGQATVGLEILKDTLQPIDYLFLPIGGGGLAAGVSAVFQSLSPQTKIIGVEPEGAPAMKNSIALGQNTALSTIDKFVDGAAVKQVGQLNFEICKVYLDEVVTVPEGLICSTMLQLYNRDAIVVEPAGALSLAALEQFAPKIKGKNVVCVISGSNNDISRTEEIRERSLLYEGLKHYFIIRFPQRAGALKEFLSEVLGPDDDIVHFEYTKKTSREKGPALVGIELKRKADLAPLFNQLKKKNFDFEYLNEQPDLFGHLI